MSIESAVNTADVIVAQEIKMQTAFLEKQLSGNEPARCVDGRPAANSEQGPQMLGGSLLPIVLAAIYNNSEIDSETIADGLAKLQSAGFRPGVHRGSHRHEDASDCGFADRLTEIIETVKQRRELITGRILQIHEANRDKFEALNLPNINELLNQVFEKIEKYSLDKIEITGETLVKTAEDAGSVCETVEGDHAEQVAFVNLKPNTTLDTTALNQQGDQAFNLDAWALQKQAKTLGVPDEFSIPASLTLYSATEIVLVEDKGKPALAVEIRN